MEMLIIDEFAKMIDQIHKKIHSVFVIWNKENNDLADYESIDEGYYKNAQSHGW